MKRFLRYWLYMIVTFFLFLGCKQEDSYDIKVSSGTNILLIVADDLGTELGFLGDSRAKTPNLNTLAEKSVVFTNAYVTQSSCSPSRSSILTGLYPHSTGQIGLAPGFSMGSQIKVLPEFFHNSNYFTGLIGKVHVERTKSIANEFDWAKYLDFGTTRNFEITTKRIKEFLERKETKPWFLMASVYDPHRAMGKFENQVNGLPSITFESSDVTPLPFQQVNHSDQLKDIAGYYNSVARFDEGVGMILELLESTNQTKNTVIIVLSDHGSPFVRAKTSLYEAGIKVPLIIHIPSMKSYARKEVAFVSTVDLVPTILDLAGIQSNNNFQGVSLLPLFKRDISSIRSTIFAEFNYHGNQHFYPRRSIRRGRYKLIHNLDTTLNFPFVKVDFDNAFELGVNLEGTTSLEMKETLRFYVNPTQFELYDLEKDPYELSNLSLMHDYKEILENLKKDLVAVRKKTNDI